jgi:hypothetical protein
MARPVIDARAQLLRLIGRPIPTFGGATVTVLDVWDRTVGVRTPDSPEGTAVHIASVQRSIDRLLRQGEVSPTAAALGPCSEFVAAVLLTLPGAARSADPARIVWQRRSRWTLRPGSSVSRGELHDRFGGNRRTRISPSRSTPNVFVFSNAGSGHGSLDRWEDGVLHCVGEARGAQSLTPGNSAILDHRRARRALRVFWGTAGKVEYAGRFELDRSEPFYWVRTPTSDDVAPRRVIMFRLVPQGPVLIPHRIPRRRMPVRVEERGVWERALAHTQTRFRLDLAVQERRLRIGKNARRLAGAARLWPFALNAAAGWPLVLLASCLAVAITTYGWTSSPLRPLVTTWFLLACPGLALMGLLPRRGAVTLLVLAIATSLSLETIVAEAMLETSAWSPRAALAVFIAVTLVGSAIQLRGKRYSPPVVRRQIEERAVP